METPLVRDLLRKNVLRSTAIIDAVRHVDRKDFPPTELAHRAYFDEALPIGLGQTISQPYTVAYMLELLTPQKGAIVMDIGAGSGWLAALLGHIVQGPGDLRRSPKELREHTQEGHVYSIEILPQMCAMAENNIAKYPKIAKVVTVIQADGAKGLPGIAAKINGFDRIISSATVADVPRAWREQLRSNGTMVYPQDGALIKETKQTGQDEEHVFVVERFPGFVFVPLTHS